MVILGGKGELSLSPKGYREAHQMYFLHTYKVCTPASPTTEGKWEKGLVTLGGQSPEGPTQE